MACVALPIDVAAQIVCVNDGPDPIEPIDELIDAGHKLIKLEIGERAGRRDLLVPTMGIATQVSGVPMTFGTVHCDGPIAVHRRHQRRRRVRPRRLGGGRCIWRRGDHAGSSSSKPRNADGDDNGRGGADGRGERQRRHRGAGRSIRSGGSAQAEQTDGRTEAMMGGAPQRCCGPDRGSRRRHGDEQRKAGEGHGPQRRWNAGAG